MNFLVDTHSHTIASGHAYSTIKEMAAEAKSRGLKALAITDHAPEMPGSCGMFYFDNLGIVPREESVVRLFMGAEVNIMAPDGTIDLPEKVCRNLDIVVASIHPPCYGLDHTPEETLRAYAEVMSKPYINIIGHPDDGRFSVDYEALIKMAKETGTLLEINNSSLNPNGVRAGARKNTLVILDLCKKHGVPVTVGSDAHIDVQVADFSFVREVLDYCDFPEDLIVNTNLEKLKPYLNLYKTL